MGASIPKLEGIADRLDKLEPGQIVSLPEGVEAHYLPSRPTRPRCDSCGATSTGVRCDYCGGTLHEGT